MYQPALRPDQITQLYYLKLQRRKPMTRLLREAVDQYLEVHAEELEQLVKETKAILPTRKREQQRGWREQNSPAFTERRDYKWQLKSNNTKISGESLSTTTERRNKHVTLSTW
jgi:hypothetical protein